MNKFFTLIIILFSLKSYTQKEIFAKKKVQSINVDGVLDEVEWQRTYYFIKES